MCVRDPWLWIAFTVHRLIINYRLVVILISLMTLRRDRPGQGSAGLTLGARLAVPPPLVFKPRPLARQTPRVCPTRLESDNTRPYLCQTEPILSEGVGTASGGVGGISCNLSICPGAVLPPPCVG